MAAENRNAAYRGHLFREFHGRLSDGGSILVGGGPKDFVLPVTGHEGPEWE